MKCETWIRKILIIAPTKNKIELFEIIRFLKQISIELHVLCEIYSIIVVF